MFRLDFAIALCDNSFRKRKQTDLPGASVKSGLSVTGREAAHAADRVKKRLAENGLM